MSNKPYINTTAPNGVIIKTKGWATRTLKVTANYDTRQVEANGNIREGLTFIKVNEAEYDSGSITINLDDTKALRDALTAIIDQTEADKRKYDAENAPEKKRLKELLDAPLGTVIRSVGFSNVYTKVFDNVFTKVNDDLWHSKTSGLHYTSQDFSLVHNYNRYEDVKR